MRHSLAQLLATSSDRRSPRAPAAACSFPRSGSGRGSPGEACGEAEPRHDEEAALLAASLLEEEPDEDGGSDELLFPAGLELHDWLEAAAETRPDWEMSGGEEGQGGEGGGSPTAASEEPPSASTTRPLARPGSSRLKAAAAARLNRQKKKQYVTGLESRLQGLAAENRQLRDRNRGLCRRLRDLERETGYLRAVLANQSALGRLLSHLAGASGGGGGGAGRAGLRVGSSLFQHRAAAAVETTSFACESSGGGGGDHDYALPVPVQEEDKWGASPSPSPGGICLHVDRDRVSVEFCSVCARRAAGSVLASAAVSSSFASKIFSFRCLPCQAPLCRG